MISILKKALVFIFLLLVAETVDAKIFKWVDKNGETHYSESAPAEQKAVEIPSSPIPLIENRVSGNSAEKTMQEQEFRDRARKANLETLERASAQREATARKANCAQARQRLNILQQHGRIIMINTNGERVYMDDNTRAAEIEKMTKAAASNCESQ